MKKIIFGFLLLIPSMALGAQIPIEAMTGSTTNKYADRVTVNSKLGDINTMFTELYSTGGGDGISHATSDGGYYFSKDGAWTKTLGTFTGSTIPDSSTFPAAIQALETALEALPGITNGTGITFTTATVEGVTTTTISGANLYPTAASTTTATGNINIDGVSADHYYFSNGSTAASYTPVITAAPASGKERSIILTIGGGSGVCTLVATNITWLSGTAPTLITTTNKKLSFGCLIPSSGNAQCNAIGGAHD